MKMNNKNYFNNSMVWILSFWNLLPDKDYSTSRWERKTNPWQACIGFKGNNVTTSLKPNMPWFRFVSGSNSIRNHLSYEPT